MSKKPIIVFEGIEGSGKSHHINKVSKYLYKKKINYIKIREPGGSLNSEKIRRRIFKRVLKFSNETLICSKKSPKCSKKFNLLENPPLLNIPNNSVFFVPIPLSLFF